LDGAQGAISVEPDERERGLRVTIRFPRIASLATIVRSVRRVFDLSADPLAIGEDLARDPLLAPLVAGRPVRNLDPQEGLFVDEEGNSYRVAGGGQAKPDYAEQGIARRVDHGDRIGELVGRIDAVTATHRYIRCGCGIRGLTGECRRRKGASQQSKTEKLFHRVLHS